MLKLKGSMGLVGAEALPNNRRYAYLTIVGDGLGGYIFGVGSTLISFIVLGNYSMGQQIRPVPRQTPL